MGCSIRFSRGEAVEGALGRLDSFWVVAGAVSETLWSNFLASSRKHSGGLRSLGKLTVLMDVRKWKLELAYDLHWSSSFDNSRYLTPFVT